MQIGADNGSSDGALLGDANVVVLLCLADIASVAGSTTDGIMMVHCLA